ncbi:GNAT family N-acetyltransferase, partial [Amycolatopsis rhizosphaerae]
EVDRRRAVLRAEVPAGGEIELVGPDAFAQRMPGVYAAIAPSRPGMMTRPPHWWPLAELQQRWADDAPVVTVVHHGPSGPDGYVIYQVDRKHWNQPSTLEVVELVTAGDAACGGLWRYLLGVDLVDTIKLPGRPLDEFAPLLFTDPRRCARTEGGDGLWLRLVDVPSALAARTYEGEPVVIEVADPVLEDNSGRYRISPGGVERTDRPAELRLDVDALAMLYLGAWRASALATAGRVRAADESALTRADRLFATETPAWCGTHF